MIRAACRPIIFVFIFFLLTPIDHAEAITLGFDPVAQNGAVGSPIDVDLFITGLGAGMAPSLGAFDIDIQFDSTVAGFNSVVYGDQLDILGLGSIQETTIGSGTVNFLEVSLDSVAELNSSQRGRFTLATITYDLSAAGVCPLNITSFVLSDAFGQSLDADISGGELNSSPVPEPATLLLFGAGLVGLFGANHRKKKK